MSPKRILVVDDEESIGRLLKLNLEKTGDYVVQTETQGARAVETARRFQPDLVLLDVMMPDLDGSEVAVAMLASPDLRQVPILFLTASVRQPEPSAAEGFVNGLPYIAKPLNIRRVLAALQQHLRPQTQNA